MIFRIAALLLSLSSLQFASAIEVSMIDMEDLLENHRIITDSSIPYQGSSYNGNKGSRGLSMIKPGLKKLLIKAANQEIDPSQLIPSEWHEVQTTFLTGTSNYHQDHKHDQAATLVEDEVGFVALNTNEDAYFDHPDMKVPIREGAFIRFKGSDPHRTVVNKGSVHLLGPFDLQSLGKVGGSGVISGYCCDSDSDSQDSQCRLEYFDECRTETGAFQCLFSNNCGYDTLELDCGLESILYCNLESCQKGCGAKAPKKEKSSKSPKIAKGPKSSKIPK